MISYEIIVRCICGKTQLYKLNCYKNQLVIVGREQETSFYPQISLCGDDKHYLSRATLYFAYDYEKKDWIVGNGFPDKKYWKYIPQIENIPESNKNNKMEDTFISYANKGYRDQVIKDMLLNTKYECEELYKDKFFSLSQNNIQKLSDIDAIGIYPIDNDVNPLYYKNERVDFFKHPLMPNLPFGWYIEIKNSISYTKAILSRLKAKNLGK